MGYIIWDPILVVMILCFFFTKQSFASQKKKKKHDNHYKALFDLLLTKTKNSRISLVKLKIQDLD